jgi:hypothetical protein
MQEQPDNIILIRLQEMRTETTARDEKMQAQIGILAERLTTIGLELKRMNAHMGELAMAVDHHTARLDKIEKHLGLDAQKH